MKFLIDAQLPPSLKRLFTSKGYDCIHTLDLVMQNDTPDRMINSISVNEQRIVITKDGDFLDSFILKKEPYKLILVKLGNISKNELLKFFVDKFDEIIEKIKTEEMILLTKD
jgi:predicted nuclease of predicted toxin-antitoxin system